MKLKFVDLNIWLGGKIFDPMLNFLKEENPDILTVQEIHNGQENDLPRQLRSFSLLKEKLGYQYAYFAPCLLKDYLDYKTDQGNAIFSRFPISKQESWFFDTPYGEFKEGDVQGYLVMPRTLQHAQIEISNKTINVFNIQGIWGKDGFDSPRRLKMGEFIANKVKNEKKSAQNNYRNNCFHSTRYFLSSKKSSSRSY